MEERREEFVRRALSSERSKSALCREYGISRPTGDKWIKRFKSGESMENKSRAPFHTPNKTDAATESSIVALRLKHPAIGAKKLKRILENKGEPAPAYSTINAILQRNGLITKEASAAATPHIRFEKISPNEMWQTDFKGHFAMKNGCRCHPLTVLDDHSRFCLCLDARENERCEGVKESFARIFAQHGLPDTLLCDNGNPWGTVQSVGYTSFEVWLMDFGILTKHGRIRHPQTQGKEERFNATLLRERIRYREYEGFAHAQRDFDEYRDFYNYERPHHALRLETPSKRYSDSARKLPQQVEEWVYGSDVCIRQIKSSGYLTFRGQGYFLSEAFGGKTVGLIESDNGSGVFFVLYRQFCIAKLSIDDRVVLARRAFRWKLETPQNV
ncbi:MAG: IS481 family transposase [Oscillospiraceae bacterium]|nr:IS481 family transposase [Oscillospiraceae bacterium]